MQRAWLVGPVLLALVVAGCTQAPDDSARNDAGGGTVGTGVSGNVTAGNGTAGGNASIGTYGNATAGNATGNETEGNSTEEGNATANATYPQELWFGRHEYGASPPESITFTVNGAYARLVANASAEGVLAGLRVVLRAPDGAETVLLESSATAGSVDERRTELARPALGEWTLRFEGSGAGRAIVTIDGE